MARNTTTNRCPDHPAFEADYCPSCGTSVQISTRTNPNPTRRPRTSAAAKTAKKTTAKVTPIHPRPQNIGGPRTSVEHPPASPRVTPAKKTATKAPAKKTPAKKTPAKVAAKVDPKAPAKTVRPTRKSKTPTPAHPGKTWVVLLEEKGLSQSEAARQMGVAPMTLNRLINGHGIPTAKVCVAFARVLGQDVTKVWNEVAAYELALALTK
jgi:plasmid maintenance system antidote protein VapI